MRYLIKYSIKYIVREKFKSLSIPMISFALAYLLCVMGGIKVQLEEEFNYMMDSYPINIVVSDTDGIKTEGLKIGGLYVEQFTDQDALWPLGGYVENLQLRRELAIIDGPSNPMEIKLVGVNSGMAIEYYNAFLNEGTASAPAYVPDMPESQVHIKYFSGYSEENLWDNTNYCIVSEDVLEWSGNPSVVSTRIGQRGEHNVRVYNLGLQIVGTVSGLSELGLVFINTERAVQYFRYADIRSSRDVFYVDEAELSYIDSGRTEVLLFPNQPAFGCFIGISVVDADDTLISEDNVPIAFIDDYDENIFASDEDICVVSEQALHMVEDGVLTISVRSSEGGASLPVGVELKVVGSVSIKDEVVVYAPFAVASRLGRASDMVSSHSELLRATLIDNRDLVEFKQAAIRTFRELGGFYINHSFYAMTIYDDEFYDVTEAVQQTLFFIDITTPFVYLIVICIGFITSFLMTQRRKGDYAKMRSIGVNRFNIFLCVLFEQATLCAAGAAIGSILFTLQWNIVLFWWPLVFLGCYILGATFTAVSAAGTDVLKLLSDKS